MFLSKLNIKGYKGFNEEFSIEFNDGFTVLVGENGSGKSAIIDAIRLLLLEDEYGRTGVIDSNFHRSVEQPAKSKGANEIAIRSIFDDLDDNEQVAYLPWLDLHDTHKAILNLKIENKEDQHGRFKRTVWGSDSATGIFEWELLNAISCVYLPPLRDAEEKLKAYRGSRLSRLLKNLREESSDGEQHPLEKRVTDFNKELLDDDTIKKANQAIKSNLKQTMGTVFGQDAMIQFSEVNFDRIVERLKLLYYPRIPEEGKKHREDLFRELEENSLGYNNILYLATVLVELEGLSKKKTLHKILLIEEPEAHLHPQLQIRLLQYLEFSAKAEKIQVIVTTHSPTIAASVGLDSMKVLTFEVGRNPICTSISKCGLNEHSKFFLERWLDVTKSTLLFAKGILLVEGITETLLIPELAKIVIKEKNKEKNAESENKDLPTSLEDYGVSVINMGGKWFKHFFQLFKGYTIKEEQPTSTNPCPDTKKENEIIVTEKIPIKCAGITDCDPLKEEQPTSKNPCPCTNIEVKLIEELLANSANCRLFKNLKTLEYDLALADNNLQIMSKVYLNMVETDGAIKQALTKHADTDWSNKNESEKSETAKWLLDHIEKIKGEFAQRLAAEISLSKPQFVVPKYIKDAILWCINEL